MPDTSSQAELNETAAHVSAWLANQALENPAVAGVESDTEGPNTWYVRFNGESREFFSVELELRQRSLAFSSYFLPSPRQNHQEFFEHILRKNLKLFGMAYAIGADDGIYLRGNLHNSLVAAEGELDRVLGSIYAYTEETFPAALRIGFIGS